MTPRNVKRSRTPKKQPKAVRKKKSPGKIKPSFVIGIGASAGGLEAFSEFFAALPSKTGMAFVLIQHLDPDHESILPALIAKTTDMPVASVADGMPIQADHVYVIPPAGTIGIKNGTFILRPRAKGSAQHLPIDAFFTALATDAGERAIGIVLSGTASDGSQGVAAIKNGGGITLAQNPAGARFDGMPRKAIASGCIDMVLSPAEMAQELIRLGRQPLKARRRMAGPASFTAEDHVFLQHILALLRDETGIDFLHYKQTTLERRIHRRMLLQHMETLANYAAELRKNPDEMHHLVSDVLIGVTGFFRDRAVFTALARKAFGRIAEGAKRGEPIRVWVPGCSSGEEVFSLAICLSEYLHKRGIASPVQIFGTDVSEEAIEKARAGIFTTKAMQGVSPARRKRFFKPHDGGFKVCKEIREMCIFARQDMTRDPPFSQLDLISCRNVLIYLGKTLQHVVMPLFHYALKPGGFLLLGSAEVPSGFADLFQAVDHKHRLYSRGEGPSHARRPFFLPKRAPAGLPAKMIEQTLSPAFDLQRATDEHLVRRFVPACVVVDDRMEILQFRGRTGPYLDQPPGRPSMNLLKMARSELLPELHSAITAVRKKSRSARREGIRLKEEDGRTRSVALEVAPLKAPRSKDRYFIILFEEMPMAASDKTTAAVSSTRGRSSAERRECAQLKHELDATKTFLQSIIEEQNHSNEELITSNEEILSANEELQSTNEELETAKEELQSTNEEINTVNEELQNRNDELGQVNDVLDNLITSITIPIVMLGGDLRVRKITPATKNVLGLTSADIGRAFTQIRTPIDLPGLKKAIDGVLHTLTVFEQELQTGNKRWYRLQIRPYRTHDNRIDGVVLVFLDIDDIKRGQIALQRARDFAEGIIATVREPLLVLDAKLRVVSANKAFCTHFHQTKRKTEGQALVDLGDQEWKIPALLKHLKAIIAQGGGFESFEVARHFPGIGERMILLNARQLHQKDEETPLILLALEDITERWRAEVALEQKAHALEGAVKTTTAELHTTQEQLIQADKLAGIGRLAAGVAHELNSPLTGLTALLEARCDREVSGTPGTNEGTMMIEAVRYMASIVKGLSEFSRPSSFDCTTIDPLTLIDQALLLCRNRLRKTNIRVVKEIGTDLPSIEGDRNQLQQVCINIVNNACDAMPDGGTLTIRTKPLKKQKALRMECIDTGEGINPDTLPHIFDPFFTTKKASRGIGLGLSICHGIITAHKGTITVQSKAHKGTTVALTLPIRHNQKQTARR